MQHRSVATIEGMGQGHLGPHPPQAVRTQVLRRKRRGTHAEGMNGRTDIVDEARQRQLRRARAPADRVGGLEHQHRPPGFGETHRRGEAVRARTDDDSVVPLTH